MQIESLQQVMHHSTKGEVTSSSANAGTPRAGHTQERYQSNSWDASCIKPIPQRIGFTNDRHLATHKVVDRRAASLDSGLQRLDGMLASLPRAARQQAIARFSEKLRCALIEYIELGRRQGLSRMIASASESVIASRSEIISRSQAEQPCHILGRALNPGLVKAAYANVCHNRPGGICTIRAQTCNQYFARITIDGIAISSRCTKSLEEARRLHGQLVEVWAAKPCGDYTAPETQNSEWLRVAFLRTVDEGVSWSFRVLVDARRWTGQIISTCRLGCVAEALALRQRLEDACLRGWATLRAALTLCLPKRRSAVHLQHTQSSLIDAKLALFDARHMAIQARRQRDFQRRQSRALARVVRREENRARRLDRRVVQLVARLERVLLAHASSPANRADELLQKKRHLIMDNVHMRVSEQKRRRSCQCGQHMAIENRPPNRIHTAQLVSKRRGHQLLQQEWSPTQKPGKKCFEGLHEELKQIDRNTKRDQSCCI